MPRRVPGRVLGAQEGPREAKTAGKTGPREAKTAGKTGPERPG